MGPERIDESDTATWQTGISIGASILAFSLVLLGLVFLVLVIADPITFPHNNPFVTTDIASKNPAYAVLMFVSGLALILSAISVLIFRSVGRFKSSSWSIGGGAAILLLFSVGFYSGIEHYYPPTWKKDQIDLNGKISNLQGQLALSAATLDDMKASFAEAINKNTEALDSVSRNIYPVTKITLHIFCRTDRSPAVLVKDGYFWMNPEMHGDPTQFVAGQDIVVKPKNEEATAVVANSKRNAILEITTHVGREQIIDLELNTSAMSLLPALCVEPPDSPRGISATNASLDPSIVNPQ